MASLNVVTTFAKFILKQVYSTPTDAFVMTIKSNFPYIFVQETDFLIFARARVTMTSHKFNTGDVVTLFWFKINIIY